MMASAPYMAWAKSRPHASFDLALSNVLPCTAAEIDGAADALDFTSQNDDGFPPLLDAIAERYGVTPDRVATATGTSGANFLAGLALIEPGDEVLVESPVYDPLLAIPRALGARVTRFERRFEDHFAIDADAVIRAITPATRLAIVTHPHNPSGRLTPDAAIARIADAAARHGGFVLVDEVYLDAAAGCGATPAARLADNIVSTNSLTKSYGLAPLRCGWAIASPPIAERIRRARDVVDGTGSVPSERLAVLAFRQLARLAGRAQAIVTPNVEAFRAFLAGTPQLEGFVQHGTVAFPRLRSGSDTDRLARALLHQHATAVVPGRFFEAPAHFRVGLGIEPAVLATGLARIRAHLDSSAGRG